MRLARALRASRKLPNNPTLSQAPRRQLASYRLRRKVYDMRNSPHFHSWILNSDVASESIIWRGII
jgi:hypothetical protein